MALRDCITNCIAAFTRSNFSGDFHVIRDLQSLVTLRLLDVYKGE